MGWSASEQVLTYPFTKLKAGSRGDLENAVSRTCTSQADLFANGTINKWAKYKPVVRPNVSYADQLDSNHQWKSTADWWKGQDGQCGLTFTTFNSLYTGNNPFATGSFLQKLRDWTTDMPWGYTRPSGSSSQPLRAFDFIQYYAAAPKPVTGIYDNLRLYGGGKLTVQLDETRAANDLGIQLDDLIIGNSATSGWYVGILIYKSTSLYSFAFSTNTLGNGADTVEFTGMGNFAGAATIVPFISSVRANQGTNPNAGTFLSCDVAPQSVTIAAESTGVQMTIDAQFKYSLPGPVKYNIRIINNSGSTITVSNMVIALYDGDPSSGGVRVEYKPTIATFSMSNEGTHDETGTFNNQNYDSTKTYYVVVSSSRPEVNGKAAVEPHRG